MKKTVFTGSAVALVTPMKEDGSIDYDMLERLVDFQIQNGSEGIVACATTGESPVLSVEEHCKIVRCIVKKAGGRVPVIASSGSNDTKSAVELSKAVEDAGADALLTITPYYNKTSQEGFVRHFFYIADRVKLPMILYNIPSRTGCNIRPETYKRLAEHPNIVGVKEANGNLAENARTAALCGDDLALYSGEDSLTLPILSLGGKGVVSTSANVIPKEMDEICRNYFQGNFSRSRAVFLKYLDVMNALFLDVNPIPVKAALKMIGFDCGGCRLPLTELNAENTQKLRAVLRGHGLLAG